MKPLNTVIAVLGIVVPLVGFMAFFHSDVTEDIRRVESGLTENIRRVESGLTKDIRRVESSLTEDIRRVESSLTENIARVESSLAAHTSEFVSFKDAALVQHSEMKADLATLLERTRPPEQAKVASTGR